MLTFKRLLFLYIFFPIYLFATNMSFYNSNTFLSLKEDELIVSNFPESIKAPGVIFDDYLRESSVRVMYHHKNGLSYSVFVVVSITNESKIPAKFQFMKGLGGSSEDVVFTGHISMAKFMQSLLSGGETISLDSGETKQLIFHKIKSGKTVSGLFRVARDNNPELNLNIRVVDAQFPSLSGFADVPSILDRFKYGRFSDSYVHIKETFRMDGVNKVIRIGDAPYVKDSRTGIDMKGNYGAAYYVDILLYNPKKKNQNLVLFFSPVKKDSVDRGVILLDETVVETDILTYKGESKDAEQIGYYTLEPKEERRIRLFMIPQAGVFYPIDLTFYCL